ncbi:cysteine dioxygenase [Streptomyces thinghirensis]|nr:cysteine dioxygenase [Streptomyces thinghirensis]
MSVSSPVSASAATAAPTQTELLDFVRRAAADAELIASLRSTRRAAPGSGWPDRPAAEAWLIGWPPGTGTGWHDHAESVGAFVTTAGELTENALAAHLPTDGWKTLELTDGVDRKRRLPTGKGRAFGRHHVHEVLNESPDRHAVSVHAYYPPLPADPPLQPQRADPGLEQVERPEDWQ